MAPAPATTPTLLPPHVVVLLLVALAAVLAGHHAGSMMSEARVTSTFDSATRRAVGFGVLFNATTLAVLAAATLLEVVGALRRLVRGTRPMRAVGRFAAGMLPLAAFAAGHLLMNPWWRELLGPMIRSLRSG
jgi:hypothetical protein